MSTPDIYGLENNYRDIVDNIPCGLIKVVVSPDGSSRPVFVNKAFLKMTEMTRGQFMELYGTDTLAGLHPDDVGRISANMRDFTPGREFTAEYRVRRGEKNWLWVRATVNIKEENGALVLYNNYINVNDAHEHAFMLDSMIDNMPGGVAVFRAGETKDCLYFNEGFSALSERTVSELQAVIDSGEFWNAIIYPPDLPLFMKTLDERMSAGSDLNITFRFLTKNGGLRWANMIAKVFREDEGRPVYYCVITTPPDEAALYQIIAENSNIGVIVSDIESREVYYTNRAFRDMMHIKDELYRGKKCYEYVRGLDNPCAGCAVGKLEPGKTCTAIHHFPQYGTYLKVKSSLINWAGHTALLEYNLDITEEYRERIQQQELINHVPAGIGFHDIVAGVPVPGYLNDYYFSMVGFDRDSMMAKIGDNALGTAHPDDVPKLQAAIDRLVSGGKRENVIYRTLCGDGNYHWFQVNMAVAKRSGERLTVYTSHFDIDDAVKTRVEQEKATAALQKRYENEKLQRRLLEESSTAVLNFNFTQNLMHGFAKTQKNFNSYPPDITVDDFIATLQQKIPCRLDKKAAADFYDSKANIDLFEAGTPEHSVEFRIHQNDGRIHWVKQICRMAQDENGDIVASVFVSDTSVERKKEQAMRSVVDDETDFILLVSVYDGMSRLLRLNEAHAFSEKAEGDEFPFAVLIASRDVAAILPESMGEVRDFLNLDYLKARLNESASASVNFLKKGKDGVIRRKRFQAAYLNGFREDIVLMSKDITESYEEEQRVKRGLEAANRAKTEFLSRVSHDMRTPLNAVLGFTRLLGEEEDLSKTAAGYLKNIDDSGRYLLGLISDVLDMSKIEEGKLELHPEPYFYTEFAETITTLLMPRAQEKGINFNISCEVVSHQSVYFDKLRLQQIFVNLIGNAIKFTPSGGNVVFTISSGDVTEDGCLPLVFTVRDDGVGMSESFIKNRLYGVFEQEHSGMTAESGSGLGLSIAKQLVGQMGGEITCESVVGEGTTFTVKLSPHIAGEYVNAPPVLPEHPLPVGARILLCEDNRLNAVIAEKLLEKAGCKVDTASNGRLGVERFSASVPGYYDAILMDIRMPELDGIEAVKQIRSLSRSDAQTVSIVAMSANAFDEDVAASLAAGMDAHIAKPVDPQKLYETLSALLCIKRKQQ